MNDISADGSTIVGHGIGPDGYLGAWVINIWECESPLAGGQMGVCRPYRPERMRGWVYPGLMHEIFILICGS
ncbi:MAG: hypothetical protein JEZ07_17660 [Phycisphaerae bacterium]|nr:hypothetical protein [Phycisphaerae bacterium]